VTSDARAPRPLPGRWEQLFADLEAQLAAGRAADARWDVAELTRAERSRVGLVDRLRATVGARVRVVTGPGAAVEGLLVDAAAEWLLLDVGGARRAVVPVAAIQVVDGLGARVAPPARRLESALGLGHVLRALVRDRVVATVRTSAGEHVGRLERVGADHVEIALDSPPGRTAVIPFAALHAVVSR
jgi:hypothetical protein